MLELINYNCWFFLALDRLYYGVYEPIVNSNLNIPKSI